MGRKKQFVDELLEQAIVDGRPIWPPMTDKTAIIRFVGYIPPKPKKILVQTRYECWTREGKTWCKWFKMAEADTEKEAKLFIKEYKQRSVNGKLHLKDDFQIIDNPKYVA